MPAIINLEEELKRDDDCHFTSDILKEAHEEHRKEVKSRLKVAAVEVYQRYQETVEENLKSVRFFRQQEKDALAKLKAINRAMEEFDKSGNPIPLLKAINPMSVRGFCLKHGFAVPVDK